MLNETPKKEKKFVDYAHPTKSQLFWRIQKECWRRMVTPYLMYFFMSLLMLACQAIDLQNDTPLEIALGIACIVGGACYNGHLCYHYGSLHYDAYCAGCLHRRNETEGIPSGGDHHVEREYRPWKGFYIGLLVGVPVLLCTIIAAATGSQTYGGYAYYAYVMFAGWAIIPVRWVANATGASISVWWTLLFLLLPIAVSGVMYLVGAAVNRSRRERQAERARRIEEAGKAEKQPRVQTEEQRRKTLQSKKKKR